MQRQDRADKPVSKPLSTAQRRHIAMLAGQLNAAQTALDAAQKAMAMAQSNADSFVTYCAEELELPLGQDGWSFVQNELAFVKIDRAISAQPQIIQQMDESRVVDIQAVRNGNE